MFPIRDPAGRTVAFGGRVLPGAATTAGKYVNSAESGLFTKNRVVFALDVARAAIVERDAAVVMEGYADCIMAHQFGITNAVATLGHGSHRQSRHGTAPVYSQSDSGF